MDCKVITNQSNIIFRLVRSTTIQVIRLRLKNDSPFISPNICYSAIMKYIFAASFKTHVGSIVMSFNWQVCHYLHERVPIHVGRIGEIAISLMTGNSGNTGN